MELSIINETQQLIEKSIDIYYKINDKYYNKVLKFLNLLFEDNAKSITKIKFKKITININVFTKYNNIITKFNINKDLFDIENFNIEQTYEIDDIIKVAIILSNNVLEKLNYKMYQTIYNDKKKIFIKYNN